MGRGREGAVAHSRLGAARLARAGLRAVGEPPGLHHGLLGIDDFAFTVDGAAEAERDGLLHDWLQAFLRGPGDSVGLADGLLLAEHWYLGPIEFPLDRLFSNWGPDPTLPHPRNPAHWHLAVSRMCEALADGWEAPPLVVDGKTLEVCDGTHRLDALRRAGRDRHWAIFWFDRLPERRWEDTLESAFSAQAAGDLARWLQEFLHGSGNNDGLAGLLLVYGRDYVGPVEVPFAALADYRDLDPVYDSPEELVRREAMETALRNGWRPPPLIVAGDAPAGWHISDGGHRIRALERVGYDRYWTIFHVASHRKDALVAALAGR